MTRWLALGAALLAGCTRPSVQPDGGWEFFPNELVYNTTVGETDGQRFTITNTAQEPVEIAIERPVPDGDCPESPFVPPAESVRIGPNSEVEILVVHAPLTATACNFLITLYNRDDDETGVRALRLTGGVRDVDSDEDGWGRGEGDCDDRDPAINPDAVELCDDIDNDCDDLIDDEDDSVADQQPWLPDTDGDTFPADVEPLLACRRPVGFVSPPDPATPPLEAWDCNDQVFEINPAAPEQVGSGIDQDCNGFISCYADDDLDTFGDPTEVVDHRLDDPFCLDAGVTLTFTDCDDANGAINPNALEVCDGGAFVDEDCDGLANDADPSVTQRVVWYLDGDEDGQGQTAITTLACATANPSTSDTVYVRNGTDCNDANDAIYAGADEVCNGIDDDCDGVPDNDPVDPRTWYIDADNDLFGEAGTADTLEACAQPLGYSPNQGDCDDANATVNPGSPEIPGDGIDSNCDLLEVCYVNADGDAYGSPVTTQDPDLTCGAAHQLSPVRGDCDDGNATVYPGALEVCDGLDNDCDGRDDDTDDDLATTITWYRDSDGDGFGDPGFPQRACTQPVGFVAEPASGTPLPNGGFDCDDRDPGVQPSVNNANEAPANGVDESCDGLELCYVDDDGDGYGDDAGITVTSASISCSLANVSSVATDCDDTLDAIHPGAPERCDAADVDEDCDGLADDDDLNPVGTRIWFADGDGDGFGSPEASIQRCDGPPGYVTQARDCNDANDLVNPNGIEVCNTLDDDCDGFVDDADSDLDPTDPSSLARDWFLDGDGDAYGDPLQVVKACAAPFQHVSATGDCDDGRPDVNPGAPESPADGIDSNCDGDERCYVDADGDDWGLSATTTGAGTDCTVSGAAERSGDCNDGVAAVNPGEAEVCDGFDNDCDGLADDLDEDVQPGSTDDVRFLRDGDGDGFGNPGEVRFACAQPVGFVPYLDAGSPADPDCNDSNAAVFPGAPEATADGVDADCDTTEVCWEDADGDGFGGGTNTLTSSSLTCRAPGVSANADDCDDARADVNPGATEICDPLDVDEDCDGLIDDADGSVVGGELWFRDGDGDTFGNPAISALSCAPPTGFVGNDADCDDRRLDIHPNGVEVCDPLNVDEDCDGLADDADPDADVAGTGRDFWPDLDGDLFGDENADPLLWPLRACDPGAGEVANDDDCLDANAAVRPGAAEIVADGLDQNCDGEEICYVNADGDAFGSGTASPVATTDLTCDPSNGFSNNNLDCDDGDALTGADQGAFFLDSDGDGHGNPAVFVVACTPPPTGTWVSSPDDCDDGNPNVSPSERERCDAIDRDDDCDGLADDLDPERTAADFDTTTFAAIYPDTDGDGFGDASASATQACDPGFAEAANALDCDDTESSIRPGATEIAGDGVDQNCDSQERCYVDADGDTWGTDTTQLVAMPTTCTGLAGAARPGDCADGNASRNPDATEVCDGVDNDCDDLIDDADADRVTDPTDLWYRDGDADGYGSPTSTLLACAQPGGFVGNDLDCNDSNAAIKPGANEQTADGVDQDCDGFEVCFTDADGDGFGSTTPTADDQPLDCSTSGGSLNDDDCDDSNASVLTAGSFWFFDADGDGHAGGLTAVEACASPGSRWDTAPDDCDDADASVSPSATETCNDRDDDCDGTIDNGFTRTTWYDDFDGDGYGSDTSATTSCIRPSGYIATGGDCDDTEPAVYPGATETCDGLNNNCSATTFSPDEGATDCPGTWREAPDGSIYLFIAQTERPDDAEAVCASVGYHGVWIESAAEMDWVATQAATDIGTGDSFWGGARAGFPCPTGQWSWYDPTTGGCTAFGTYESSQAPAPGGTDHGLRLDPDNGSPPSVTWRDEAANQQEDIVCEL